MISTDSFAPVTPTTIVFFSEETDKMLPSDSYAFVRLMSPNILHTVPLYSYVLM